MLGLNTETLQESYNLWGPSARDCLRFARVPEAICTHEQDVLDAAFELAKDAHRFTNRQSLLAMHQTFVARPSPKSRRMAIVEFGTNRLREIFTRTYAQQDHAVRCSFYRTIRENSWFASPARQIFEIHLLLWFWHCYHSHSFPCIGAAANSPPLSISSCYYNLKFFYKVEELKDIGESEKPICLVPTSRSFPTLSAVILTNNAVVTLQITIALKHDANEQEIDLIYKNHPPDLLARRPGRYHVFITDNEVNAKSLREQNQIQVPNGTLVYSRAISVETLDSAVPATTALVDILEKARVSMYWLCGI